MTAKSSNKKTFSLISDEKLRQLYLTMLKCRILDSNLRSIARGLPSTKRQEAAIAGAGIDLKPGDTVFSTYHGIGSYLQKAPLETIFQHIYEKPESGKKIKAPNLSSQAGLATGASLAYTSRKPGSIVLALLGNAEGQLDSAKDTLILAGLHKLPVIYLRNAGLEEEQSPEYGFPIIPVDGSDAVAVYRVAFECILRARQNGGPSMIECRFSASGRHDPIRNMEKYLEAKGLFTKGWKQRNIFSLEQETQKAMAKARKAARNSSAVKSDPVPFLYSL